MVRVNGKWLDLAGMTVSDYLAEKQYDQKRVAVECNGEIVCKANYGQTIFADGDLVEVVSFVGGG